MNTNAYLLGDRVRWWACGWKRVMSVRNPENTPEEHQRAISRSLKVIERSIAASRRLLATASHLVQSQQPDESVDGVDPKPRLTIEHGTICIRNFHGWLLWSAPLERLSRGLDVKNVLEQVETNHRQWLEAQRSYTERS